MNKKTTRGGWSALLALAVLGMLAAALVTPPGDAFAFAHKKKLTPKLSRASIMENKAAKGSPAEKFSLAAAFESGKGVKKNKNKAIQWYYKAGVGFAKKGNKAKAASALAAINRLAPGHALGIKLARKIK